MKLYEIIQKKCNEAGINSDDFIKEKLLELKERKRILFTPNKDWFLENSSKLKDYLDHVAGYDVAYMRGPLPRFAYNAYA